MANPVIHALVVIAAIIIPGGLVVYLAWRIRNRCKDVKAAKKIAALKTDPIEEIRNAFKGMYPEESLRVRNRRERLEESRRRRRRKFPK
jgi:hypothetical protein